MAGAPTASSIPDRLTALQRDLLRELFAREQSLFLSGGAALSGFDFGHRATDDLDLFAVAPATLDEPERNLNDAVAALGAVVTVISRHAQFRRFKVDRGAASCVVDLVVDTVGQLEPAKRRIGLIRVDTLRDMFANKLTTLVSRSEIRDLVDVQQLLLHGLALEQGLADALKKDGSADAATIAFTLDQLRIGPGARLPGDTDAVQLELFRVDLIARLRRIARASAGD